MARFRKTVHRLVKYYKNWQGSISVFTNNDGDGIWTHNRIIVKQILCHLTYATIAYT